MIRRILVLALLLVTGLLLDTVLLSGITIAGVSPSVVVLTIVAVGLADGPESGTRFGFAAGLVVDLLSGGLVGVSALVFLLIGFIAGAIRPFLTGSALVAQVAAGGAAGACAVLGAGVLALLFDPQGVSGVSILLGTVAAGGMSALLAPLVLRPVGAILRRVDPTVIIG